MKKHFIALAILIATTLSLSTSAAANTVPLNIASTVQTTNPFEDIPVIVGGVTVGTIDITRFIVRQGAIYARAVFTSTSGATETILILVRNLNVEQDEGECTILELDLGPVFINLLGLVIELNEINLDITARPGEGLLGDLLCAIANLLNNGGALGNLANLLNQLLGAL